MSYFNEVSVVNTSGTPLDPSTSIKQDTGNSYLASLDSKAPVLGQAAKIASVPVVLASDQPAVPVSQSGTWNLTGTISLPTGAATETTISAINAKLSSLGQKTSANSTPVVLASDQSSLSITGAVTANLGTLNGAALDSSLSKLNIAQGAAIGTNTGPLVQVLSSTSAPTYITGTINPLTQTLAGSLRTDNTSWLGSIAPTVGSKTSANSIPVVIASDQSSIPVTLPNQLRYFRNATTASAVIKTGAGKIYRLIIGVIVSTNGSVNLYDATTATNQFFGSGTLSFGSSGTAVNNLPVVIDFGPSGCPFTTGLTIAVTHQAFPITVIYE